MSSKTTKFLIAALVVFLELASSVFLPSPIASAQTTVPMARVIYVNQAASGANNGVSWANAYTELHTALAAASGGDELWVAAGLYKPTSELGQVEATFQLKNDVALYGGFAGTETARAERDWTTRSTILSGDIDGNDPNGDGNFVAENASELTGNNSYHVVTGSGVTTTAVLDGFIVTAGNGAAENYPHNRGGGLLNDQGSPTLTNLLIIGNKASATGGGLHNQQSYARLTNITVSGNSAVYGGGLFNVYGASVLIGVTFQNNSASQEGGGMSNDNAAPLLTNIVFRGNQANLGGGLYNSNSAFPLTNVIFSGNRADQGGGLYNKNSAPTLTNVAVSGNRAMTGGGLYNFSSYPTLQNSIVWNNSAEQTGPTIVDDNGSTAVRHSLLQGCNPNAVWNNACGSDGGQNLADVDPLFVVAPSPGSAPTIAGDLRLQAASPAIDRGDNGVVPGSVTTDLDSQARIVNDIVDLGAYEHPSLTRWRVYLPLVTATIR